MRFTSSSENLKRNQICNNEKVVECMVVRSSVRLLKIFGEESVQLEGGWRRRSWKWSVGLKYHCIAGPRQFKSGTLDTLSTSGPLCILIIPLRFLHCAAPIVHCARCRLCNTQSSEIVHSSLCLVGRCPPGTICQCREWHHRARQGKGNPTEWNLEPWQAVWHRIVRDLHNYCAARTHALWQSVTIPPVVELLGYAHRIHGNTHTVRLQVHSYHDTDFWHISIGSTM